MNFVELPDHLNFSHLGAFSPILFRFEGGDDLGGFCIQEFVRTRPLVSLYGDLTHAKQCWNSSRNRLTRIVATNPDVGGVIAQHSGSSDWFLFDYRLPDHHIMIHRGPTAVSGSICADVLADMQRYHGMRANLRDAMARISAIYGRFYNV